MPKKYKIYKFFDYFKKQPDPFIIFYRLLLFFLFAAPLALILYAILVTFWRVDKYSVFLIIIVCLFIVLILLALFRKSFREFVENYIGFPSLIALFSVIMLVFVHISAVAKENDIKVELINATHMYNQGIINFINKDQDFKNNNFNYTRLYNNRFQTQPYFDNWDIVDSNYSDGCSLQLMELIGEMEGANRVNDSIHEVYNQFGGIGQENQDIYSNLLKKHYDNFFENVSNTNSLLVQFKEDCTINNG